MTPPADGPSPGRRALRFWRRNVKQDIETELAFHFQSRVDELVMQGLNPAAALAQAHEEFGDLAITRRDLHEIDQRIATRERRSERIAEWWRDLRYAVRSLRRAPAVAVTIIVTLALGLGANAAMFSLLNAVFLRPPAGVERPDAVRRLWTEIHFRSGPQFWSGYDYEEFDVVRQAVSGLASAITYQPERGRVGRGADATPVTTAFTSSEFFRELGVRPVLGRFFSDDEDRLGAGQNVAVASHAYWTRVLGSDGSAIGRTFVLNGEPYTLVGVAAAGFTGVDLDATDLWVTLGSRRSGRMPWWTNPNVNGFQILLRLNEGVPAAQIDAQAAVALRRLAVQRQARDTSAIVRTGSIIRARGPGDLDQEVQIATRLGGVALVVLVIACANVLNLLLARAVRRRREIAVRLALGISRARLTRLVLNESVLLALAAGAAAIVVAHWGGLALRGLLLPDVRWAQPPVDWRVLVVAVVATVLAGVAAGIVPAIQSGATSLTEALKSGTREGQVGRSRVRSVLVIAQAALSVTLLVGAALFVRSLSNVRGLDLGFDTRDLLFGEVRFDTRDARRDSLTPMRMDEVAARVRAVPGVQSVAVAHMRPLSGFSTQSYFPDADTIANRKPDGFYWAVSPEYFDATGIRILSGGGFPRVGARSAQAVLVNTAMAEALWPGQSPLGRCVRFAEPAGPCYTVSGVVENAHWDTVIEEPMPQFYLPLDNVPFPIFNGRALIVRTTPQNAGFVTRSLRDMVASAFPDGAPVLAWMSSVLEPHYRPWRLGATLFTLFGVLAAVVAAVGVYSSVSYTVSQRTHEFGVRMALGAQLVDVIRHVLGEGLRLVTIGVLVGVVLALLAGKLVASLLYGVAPHDPLAIGVVVALLLVVAVLAALGPARRAARVDPVTALRTE